MDNHMPIIVLNLWQEGSIQRAVLGQEVGTIICP
jgi:uridylate kinase